MIKFLTTFLTSCALIHILRKIDYYSFSKLVENPKVFQRLRQIFTHFGVMYNVWNVLLCSKYLIMFCVQGSKTGTVQFF